MVAPTIEEIIQTIEAPWTDDISRQVGAALRLKKQISPELLALLDRVLADPETYARQEQYWGHIYASFLLAHFEDAQAHKSIVALFSLTPPLPDHLFGDIVTEYLPLLLYKTCHGSFSQIEQLVLNRQADDFCRSGAMRAMVYAVSEGVVSRQSVVDFFGSLFTGTEAVPHSQFWSLLADAIYNLHPAELMPVLADAYRRNLISPGVISQEDLEQVFARDQAAGLSKMRAKWRRKSLKQTVLVLAQTGTLQGNPTVSLQSIGDAIKALFKSPLP